MSTTDRPDANPERRDAEAEPSSQPISRTVGGLTRYADDWTPTQRAVIYAGVMGGVSLQRINELLKPFGPRELSLSTYEWIKREYVPYFLSDMTRMGRAIELPPTSGDLQRARAMSRHHKHR